MKRKPLSLSERLAVEELRRDCFERDHYRCVDCGMRVFWEGDDWSQGHMSHLKSRGAGGPDKLENVVTRCAVCHGKSHNCGGKPCPKKPTLEAK